MFRNMKPVLDSRNYDVSPQNGFVPEKPPLERLGPYFRCWDELVDSLPALLKDGKIRDYVHKLPLLEYTKLETREEYVRAHLVLSVISHAYVWCKGEQGVAKVLPKALAVPWARVSEHLGILPVISHYTFVLNNWRTQDIKRPLSMDNISTLVSMTGCAAEEGFVKIPFQIELDAATALQAVVKAQKAVLDDSPAGVLDALDIMSRTFPQMTKSLLRVNDTCDPWEFYNTLRPYLGGWKDNPALPGGLVYEGVSSQPLQFSGGSAAESTVFQVLDAALGIEHPRSPDNEPPFLERMRRYMPAKHREFIAAVRNGPSIKHFVESSQNEELVAKFDSCVELLKDFRNNHIKVVAKFITLQAAKSSRNQDSNDNKTLSKLGTGGTGIMPFLKEVRNETRGIKTPTPTSSQLAEKARHTGRELNRCEPKDWTDLLTLPVIVLVFSIFFWFVFVI